MYNIYIYIYLYVHAVHTQSRVYVDKRRGEVRVTLRTAGANGERNKEKETKKIHRKKHTPYNGRK